jgi:TusA-related sulfurtransferase
MNTLENMEQGQVLMVITDDRGTRESLPSLCSTCGYRLLEVEEDKGTVYFIIQR